MAKRVLAFPFVSGSLVVLAVLACGPAAVPDSAENPPAVAPSEAIAGTTTSDLQASPSPRPPSAPTATKAPLLEIVASRVWTDSLGDVRVEVLLKNSTQNQVSVPFIRAVLKDSAGTPVASGDGYVFDGMVSGGMGVIFPGESVPASICIGCMASEVPAWDDYEVSFGANSDYSVSSNEYSTDFATTIDSVILDEAGLLTLSGTVTNTGTQHAEFVFLRATMYDEEGAFLGAAEGSPGPLPPGTTLPMEIFGIVDPSLGIGRYEITAVARLG